MFQLIYRFPEDFCPTLSGDNEGKIPWNELMSSVSVYTSYISLVIDLIFIRYFLSLITSLFYEIQIATIVRLGFVARPKREAVSSVLPLAKVTTPGE
jgi:hypothetical protein